MGKKGWESIDSKVLIHTPLAALGIKDRKVVGRVFITFPIKKRRRNDEEKSAKLEKRKKNSIRREIRETFRTRKIELSESKQKQGDRT